MKKLYALVCATLPAFAHAQFIPDGPDAPDATFAWSNGYTIHLNDPLGSNNYGQNYQELIPALDGVVADPFWRFQGHLIFQVVPSFSMSQNLFDTDVARLVGASDITDGIADLEGARLYQQFDDGGSVIFDTCYAEAIVGSDAGLVFNHAVTLDAFTGLVLSASDDVCYVAVAYATNADHVQEGCNEADQILIGRKAAAGAIRIYCINGFTAGIDDIDALSTLALQQVGTDQLSITGVREGRVVVLDQAGRCVLSQAVTAAPMSLRIDQLPTGSYIVMHTSADGRRAHARFVSGH